MNKLFSAAIVVILLQITCHAFCGFYVAKADAKLFNKSSEVVLARNGNHTVLTMANDYQGEPKDFAIVIPVPTVIKKDAVRVVEKSAIDHIDAYSAPRLVEYFDEDPCAPHYDKVMIGRANRRGERKSIPMVKNLWA